MTEVAHNFNWLVVSNHSAKLFSAKTDNCLLDTLLAAITDIRTRHGIGQLDIIAFKQFSYDSFHRHALLEKSSERKSFQPFLQLVNQCVLCKWHQLDDKSTGIRYGCIVVEQHAQSHRAWNLVTCCKIVGQILCNLAAYQMGVADIRLLQTDILDDA